MDVINSFGDMMPLFQSHFNSYIIRFIKYFYINLGGKNLSPNEMGERTVPVGDKKRTIRIVVYRECENVKQYIKPTSYLPKKVRRV